MIVIWRLIYNIAIMPLMVMAAYLLSPINRKVRRGLRGRRRTLRRVAKFCLTSRDPANPLYWFHVASHGEYEQTRSVIQGLREIAPETIIVVSFFSPSGYENFDHKAVDFKFYLPLDFPWTMRRLIRILNPDKVVFTSYDIWPNLIWNCQRAQIPTTLFAARVVPKSSKQWPILTNFYRHIYGAISHIYTVSEPDYSRLKPILGEKAKTEVQNLGNPRYDRVKERNQLNGSTHRNNYDRTIILGSLHKEDEEIVSPPIIELLLKDKNIKVFWAPHEPEPEVIEALSRRLSESGINCEYFGRRLGRFLESQVLIVDGIGYLAELYSRSIIAYVGGGFSHNVHNVMEAAIAAIPVLFGPKYTRSHEAGQLIKYGGGVSVNSTEEFRQKLTSFLNDEEARHKAGQAALKVIEDNLGATARILQAIISS